jgi:hypothetical protein
MSITDGHWPVARKVPELGNRTAICCACGERPKKIAARVSMLHVWHQVHRRGLRLRPVSYAWPGRMEGPSAGGYVKAPGCKWENGNWVSA